METSPSRHNSEPKRFEKVIYAASGWAERGEEFDEVQVLELLRESGIDEDHPASEAMMAQAKQVYDLTRDLRKGKG